MSPSEREAGYGLLQNRATASFDIVDTKVERPELHDEALVRIEAASPTAPPRGCRAGLIEKIRRSPARAFSPGAAGRICVFCPETTGTPSAVHAAAEAIVKKCRAERWIAFDVETVAEKEYRQERRGRPGSDTRWRRIQRSRFSLTWKAREERVAYDARCDGVFPLSTNAPENDFSALQIFDAYKSKQPALERRHHLFNNVEAAAPVLLKSVTGIEALVFLLFIALLVHALLERDLRLALQADGSGPLPLYPEDRACNSPTTARVIEVFDGPGSNGFGGR